MSPTTPPPDSEPVTDVVPEDADEWEALLSSTHLPWSVRVPEQERGSVYRAVVRRQWIDDLALVDCECDPCAGARGRKQIADTEGDYLIVLINRGGSETVSQGGREAVLRPGDAVAWDSRTAARFAVWEPLVKRSLLIPRGVLVDAGHDLTGGVRLDREAPAMQLLGSYLDTLSRTLPHLGGSAVTAARNATVELFRGALQPTTPLDPSSTAPARRDAVERFMDRRLQQRDLSVEEVAAAHGVSVRTINRLFSESGETFSAVLRTKRVARAREELLSGDAPMSAIAHRWGFFDTSHLHRSFRAVHGMSPRAYRDRARSHSEAPVAIG